MSNDLMFDKANEYLDNMYKDFPTHVPLSMLYTWDMIRDYYDDLIRHPGDTEWGDYELVPGVDLKKIWDTWMEVPFGGFDWDTEGVVEWLSSNALIQFKEEE